jgi:hypothetical protein
MPLSWQQGPLSVGAIGRFLVPEPLAAGEPEVFQSGLTWLDCYQ